jgi:hypothetical protein
LSYNEKAIYVEALAKHPAHLLEESFRRCLDECTFMPKISDVVSRLPDEKTYFDPMSVEFVPIKNWYEPYPQTSKLRIWQDAKGNRRVAVVKLKEGELPPRVARPHPNEYISLAEAWEKIHQTAKEKKL